jgi:aminobenzoyl-glutamate utilization protein B
MRRHLLSALALSALLLGVAPAGAQTTTAPGINAERLAELKKQATEGVEPRAKLAQVINDTVFSFGELAFQEFETSKYLTDILEKNGFKVERGVAGLPTG